MSWNDRGHLKASALPKIEAGNTVDTSWGRRKSADPVAVDADDIRGQIAILKQMRATADEKRHGRTQMIEAIDREIATADEAVAKQVGIVVTLINELDPIIKARIEAD